VPPAPAAITVSLSAAAATFVAGGGRDIDMTRVPNLPALEAGAQLQLLGASGEEVGIAVADPDNGKLRVLAVPADGFTTITGALLAVRVERALAWRKRLGLPGRENAYRLIHGAGDGLPGFACDVMGRVAVVYAYGEGLRALGKQLAETIVGFAQLDGAVVKRRAKGGSEDVPQDVIGTVEERAIVSEHGVPYEVHPLAGLNVGLFTDMREQRLGMPRYAPGQRVLNLFAYTGALGLACARAGAASVTNVDTSQGVLAWAKGNFDRSKLSARYEAQCGDARRFLTRAARDKERYDLVIVDPPSAGVGWATGRDYPELIAQASAVIPGGGLLWLAANTVELGPLAKLAGKGLRGRSAAIVEQAGLPPEYPTAVAQPQDRYLQILVLRLS
jgi:23S rRNA (cytosine1962-C5)-methyltransferase